jgi:hypothetical protein
VEEPKPAVIVTDLSLEEPAALSEVEGISRESLRLLSKQQIRSTPDARKLNLVIVI